MIKLVYSVYDSAAKMYGPLIAFANDEMARRESQDLMDSNDPRVPVCKYPGDFSLFRVAVMDTETGILEPERVPVLVLRYVDLLPSPVSSPSGLEPDVVANGLDVEV